MATHCERIVNDPDKIKAWIDATGVTTFNIVEIAIEGQTAIVFVEGT